MAATRTWPQLLAAIDEHGKNVQYTLAVHASRCAQPAKAEALVESLEAAGLSQAHYDTAFGAWRVSLDLPSLYAPGDGAVFHITVEGNQKAAVKREACQICLAFLLVVAPRKVVMHMNALRYGVDSKEALIAAGHAGQRELGSPLPGAHRNLYNAPRREFSDNPSPPRHARTRRRGSAGPAEPDDTRAVQALQ